MPTIPQPRFYVYVLARPNDKPFYVGKGSRYRINDHEREARTDCRCHKCNIIRKIWRNGGVVRRYIVFTTNDEHDAFEYEKATIALHGRANLCNVTDGGEGPSNPTPEARAKISVAGRARRASEETRARMRAAQAIRRGDKARQAIENERKRTDPTIKANFRRGLEKRWATPGYREQLIAASRNRYNRPEELEKLAQARAVAAAPEVKAKIGAAAKAQWADPEKRARVMEAQRAGKERARKRRMGET